MLDVLLGIICGLMFMVGVVIMLVLVVDKKLYNETITYQTAERYSSILSSITVVIGLTMLFTFISMAIYMSLDNLGISDGKIYVTIMEYLVVFICIMVVLGFSTIIKMNGMTTYKYIRYDALFDCIFNLFKSALILLVVLGLVYVIKYF